MSESVSTPTRPPVSADPLRSAGWIRKLARLQLLTGTAALLAFWPSMASLLRYANALDRAALLAAAGVTAFWLALGSVACAFVLLPVPVGRGPASPQTWDLPGLALAAGGAAVLFALARGLAHLPPLWVPDRFAFAHEIHRAACAYVALLACAAAVFVPARTRAPAWRRRWAFGLWTLAASVLVTEDALLVARAEFVRLELATLLALLLSLVGLRPGGRFARPVLATTAAVQAAAITAAFAWPTAFRAADRVPTVQDLGALAARVLDMDRDGSSAVLGGRDCDDTDPLVHPAALEIVGNGRDDNCLGGDLAVVEPARPLTIRKDHPKRSVVLVTIDTLQGRMLAPGPAGQRHMPELARFAAGSLHFTRHYAAASFTNDALGALMTGQYPPNFADVNVELGANPTLAELLAAAGYRTVTVNQATADPHWLVYRGFAEKDLTLAAEHHDYRAITSDQTTARAIAALERLHAAGEPFFFWVHYMDPHYEYRPRSGTPFAGESVLDRYHQEVYATDRSLGPLLHWLESSGFSNQGVVAITADHGEALDDAGAVGHAYSVHEDVLRTFLVLRAPGVPVRAVHTRVRSLDLYPTLLDLAAGIGAESAGAHLAPVWRGEETADRDAYARSAYKSWSLHVAIVDHWKLVDDLRTGRRALYDLRSGEAADRSGEHPDRVRALSDALGRTWDRAINDVVLRRRGLLP